jgi:sec-independent protein translocase protein TatA
MGLLLFGISMGEIVLIFLVVLMLFGSKKIPDLARTFGKGFNEFKKATDDIKREFYENSQEVLSEIPDIEKDIRNNLTLKTDDRDNVSTSYTDANVILDEDVYGLDMPEISSNEDFEKDNEVDINDESKEK